MAGTGILVFMDLIAYLVKRICNQVEDNLEQLMDEEKFKFVLYASFPNKDEAIGLPLYEGLDKLC